LAYFVDEIRKIVLKRNQKYSNNQQKSLIQTDEIHNDIDTLLKEVDNLENLAKSVDETPIVVDVQDNSVIVDASDSEYYEIIDEIVEDITNCDSEN